MTAVTSAHPNVFYTGKNQGLFGKWLYDMDIFVIHVNIYLIYNVGVGFYEHGPPSNGESPLHSSIVKTPLGGVAGKTFFFPAKFVRKRLVCR